jgi:hypothetical protein
MKSAVGLAISLASCGVLGPRPMPVNSFRADAADFAAVRRVMVLPFREADGVVGQSIQVRDAFLNELAKSRRFEVVPLPARADEHRNVYEDLTRGGLSKDVLVELSERYRIDGLVLGTLTSYRAYAPTNLGLRVQLVSLHSGRTIWAAEGLYDANDSRAVEDLQHYAESFQADEDSLHGWQINLLSPTRYASFVSHRLVGTLW